MRKEPKFVSDGRIVVWVTISCLFRCDSTRSHVSNATRAIISFTLRTISLGWKFRNLELNLRRKEKISSKWSEHVAYSKNGIIFFLTLLFFFFFVVGKFNFWVTKLNFWFFFINSSIVGADIWFWSIIANDSFSSSGSRQHILTQLSFCFVLFYQSFYTNWRRNVRNTLKIVKKYLKALYEKLCLCKVPIVPIFTSLNFFKLKSVRETELLGRPHTSVKEKN